MTTSRASREESAKDAATKTQRAKGLPRRGRLTEALIPRGLDERLKRMADRTAMTREALIRRCIAHGLSQLEAAKRPKVHPLMFVDIYKGAKCTS